ncbi:STAS domain-containing protein [Streptomyces xanthochromogenes]|uniref:Anti-anti-sigma factor n=1 Tax=Streptomyces xanthochromogenes TaxID=67384 RepID=A0ABQ3AIQ2_9ACTN|nr:MULTISPECIES: STAS domain-containing protein [Streptomyces]MYV90625.1 STAS domain-containing protein [Streptomyces sp. SID1034]GGY57783.1 anti-anti-sigma factor [Streptomyces xanthochromogenes]GHB38784.1 anti-anti-sigma factor [Streptomyces xanthochromogenes]
MTTALTLSHGRRSDGTELLTAVGEIDMSNAAELARALAGTAGPLVLDLTEVEYLDSAGLSVLFPHAERLQLVTNPLLDPVLTISGLSDLTTVHGA